MALAKADFYYGALLSQLVNSGFAPTIIERGDTRRIYSLSNDFSDFKVYAKYLPCKYIDLIQVISTN
ncbi:MULTISPECIES: hypothetical protein [Aeribacillus]|jgi:hypothetical protein|uniref:hypothetical protein n=1 Tax=Aeribacillus TaxID=1055323 RepID=UPI002E1EC87E|nr:hypothetical protein [Aeribacillus composti]